MTSPRKYNCGRCGKQAVKEEMIYSRFSGNRYCRDLNACAKRAKRKKNSPGPRDTK